MKLRTHWDCGHEVEPLGVIMSEGSDNLNNIYGAFLTNNPNKVCFSCWVKEIEDQGKKLYITRMSDMYYPENQEFEILKVR